MRKFIVFAITALLALTLPVSAYAEEIVADDTAQETEAATEDVAPETEPVTTAAEAVTEEAEAETTAEAAETATEAEETTAAESTAETENAAETETDELSALLDVATPEQVELIKQYVLYGIKSLPVSERVKLFLLDQLNAIMWIVVSAAMIAFAVVNRLTSKKHTDEAATMTDNAIEFAKLGQSAMEEASKGMKQISEDSAKLMTEILIEAKSRFDRNELEVAKYVDDASEKIKSITAEASATLRESSERENALTEALLLTDQIVAYLIENSALPEVERDRMTKISEQIAAQIEDVKNAKEAN